jgi:plastocyanin
MRRWLLLLVVPAVAFTIVLGGCGSDSESTTATSSGSGGGGAGLAVRGLDTLKFDKPAYDATAGDIDVSYVNGGSLEHTLLVRGVAGFRLRVTGQGDTDRGSVKLNAGSYELYCDVPGHEAGGMKAPLTVK